jgi:hypothetical protein
VDDEGLTGDGLVEGSGSGTGTTIDWTVGNGRTPGPVVESTAATGAGAMAERMPNHDRPTATAVTTAQATRYPIDRLTATTLP